MLTDIEIAQQAKLLPIAQIASELDIREEELEPYGRFKAKLNDALYNRLADKKDGKLILVTAINPTPAGEGKTTTTAGLGEAMKKIGKNAIIALREPSLGPVFGIKGGAAGGGYAQVVPMEDINLHFTGDFHAITSANNLLCAMLDNHMQQGNALGIDPRRILIKRCLDMNDRALRNIVIGLGGKMSGIPREDSFCITVATEIMAIFCLASDLMDLKERLGRILVAYTYAGAPVYACDLKAQGAMAALLKDAINPNLVQTLEGTPVIMHGGPFANIAHGCNSVRATRLALKLADYCITEAGFGSDLGAEKFMDIKCRLAGLKPNAIVLVATARALKYNGGVPKDKTALENPDALKKGIVNLGAHISNMEKYGVPVIVAINRFPNDSEAELRITAARTGRISRFPRSLQKAARAAWIWREKYVKRRRNRRIFSRFIPLIQRLNRKSSALQKRFTARTASIIPVRRKKPCGTLKRSVGMNFRSALQKRSILCRTMPPCWAGRPVSASPSVTCAFPTERVLSLPMRAIFSQCPDCRKYPPLKKSTWMHREKFRDYFKIQGDCYAGH